MWNSKFREKSHSIWSNIFNFNFFTSRSEIVRYLDMQPSPTGNIINMIIFLRYSHPNILLLKLGFNRYRAVCARYSNNNDPIDVMDFRILMYIENNYVLTAHVNNVIIIKCCWNIFRQLWLIYTLWSVRYSTDVHIL